MKGVYCIVAMVLGITVALPENRQLTTESCGSISMSPGERVAIQSPNYPSAYTDSYRCQWEITCETEADNYLEYRCPSFALEDSTDCANDRLILTDRGNRQELCGTSNPDGYTTSTGWTRLTFSTNNAVTDDGFRCFVWCFAKPTTTAAPTTAAPTTAAPTTAAPTTAAPTTAAPTTAAPTTIPPTTLPPTTVLC